jgi:adenylosuccinate lyase
MPFEHDTFISPFTWRYGSPEMRKIWSEFHKRLLMRRVWVALATVQHKAGLVSVEQLNDIQSQAENVDIGRAQEIEKEVRHDVMAEIAVFAEQCSEGGGIIHWGATSADITDNVDALRCRQSAAVIETRLRKLLAVFARRIEETADLPIMAYTHFQPAEPTTLGYRLSVYAQDLNQDLADLESLIFQIKGKGLKGAVGSQASFQDILAGSDMSPGKLEAEVMALLDLPYYPIATQTYSRRQDYRVVSNLVTIAATLHKFSLDFRLLMTPAIGEWAEPFGRDQVGSTAMPFKRNPILTENICSLARYLASLPAVAWSNASQQILERSLDDSANRRIFLAEAFLAADEILLKATGLLEAMVFDEEAMARDLANYGPFAASERLLTALVSAGADRQEAHEWIRQASLKAWAAIRQGQENPLKNLLAADSRILSYINPRQIAELLDAADYVGTAGERAEAFSRQLGDRLAL